MSIRIGRFWCLADPHVAQAGNPDTFLWVDFILIPLCVFTFITSHTLPGACCTQGDVHVFSFPATAFENELCAFDKSIHIRECDIKPSYATNPQALQGSVGFGISKNQCAVLYKL